MAVRELCSPRMLAFVASILLCLLLYVLASLSGGPEKISSSFFNGPSAKRAPDDETLLNKLIADSLQSLEPQDPVELRCPMYQEFRRVDFLNPVLRNKLCRGSEAYKRYQDGYPLCVVKTPFPEQLLSVIRRGSEVVQLVDMNRATMPIYAYRGKDYITSAIRQGKTWEAGLVHAILRLALKVPDTTFMDIGSNIGVYSIQAAKVGLPVVALDANIRNVLRLHLSLNASGLGGSTLVWNFITTTQQVKHLSFLSDCNVGGAGKLDAQLPDTVPVMPVRSERLSGLVKTKHIVMKMDIQGGEADFLRTSGNLFDLRLVVAVQMEWYRPMMASKDPATIVNFFTKRGYKAGVAPGLQPIDLAQVEKWDNIDVLWVHRDFVKVV